MELDDPTTQRLAEAIHAHYLRTEIAHGELMGATPALVDWADLEAERREANRALLQGAGLHAVPVRRRA